MIEPMDVLGIETTCDETAVSIVRNGKEILSHFVASQCDLHSQYGGVFPELACRRHIDILIPLIEKCLKDSGLDKTDLIAVARGPGLLGALLIGMHTAKTLSLAWDVPLVGVNHVEAHLYAAMMDHEPQFPALGVVLSGGHTNLLEINDLGEYRQIGATVDDAIGEAFDKVASLLDLPYPGGPEVEKLAIKGDPNRFDLKAGTVKTNPFAFSFSGLKTNVLYTLKGQGSKKGDPIQLDEQGRCDLAASFQRAAFSDIFDKTMKAKAELGLKDVYFGGGVTSNKALRELFNMSEAHFPPPQLSLDNAAMIAGLGYHVYQKQGADSFELEALPRIPF